LHYADADAKDWSATLDDPVLRQESRAVISSAVDQLSDKYKAVFVLREMENFSTSETAAALGLGTAAVKTRLHRARLFLRDALAF
jgi:RNA polymerase sigma-70 factor (ECF subfamily)